MKIGYLANSRFPSERAHMTQIVHMCNAFANMGAETTLVVTDRPTHIEAEPDDYYGTKVRFGVCRVHVPNIAGNILRLPKALWPIAYTLQRILFARSSTRVIKEMHLDHLYGRDEWILWFLSLRLGTDRLVWESHEAKRSFAARRLLANGVKCIVISEGIRDAYIAEGVPEEQLLVAHDGVDETFFGPVESKEEARARLGITTDRPVAMYIGGFEEWKGVETFFRAAELAPDVQFVAIGGKPEEVEKYQKQYPRVQFLGRRPYKELKDNQQAADVLVVPNTAQNDLSAKYTSPLKLFAHLTSIVPLVVSDIPSMRNVVSEKEAWFFSPDDPNSLAEMVKKVLEDTSFAQKRAKNAHELTKTYTWSVRAQDIIEFIKYQPHTKERQ